jgi:hypothetical protein
VFKIAKDKIIGAIVMVLGVLIAIIYTMGSIVDLYLRTWGGNPNWAIDLFGPIGNLLDWRLFVVVPLWIIVLLIAIIGIWIGYSMLTGIEHFAFPKKYSCACSTRSAKLFNGLYSNNWKRS